MKKYLILYLLITSIAIGFAQKVDKRRGVYSLQLVSVDVPKDVVPGTIDTLTSTYEDDVIKIHWAYAFSEIQFDLLNKSDQALKLIWDDVAYISPNNETEKVFHKKVKFSDKEKSQAPISIYPGTELSDFIAPSSYSYYGGRGTGWLSANLIPTMSTGFGYKVKYIPKLLNRTVKVGLPFKTEDSTLEYVFVFKTIFIERKK